MIKTEDQHACFRSGDEPSVEIGKVNKNHQRCCGTLSVPGTDKNAYVYKIECTLCGLVYGANSGDVHERKCPNCQDGKPGIRYWLIARRVPSRVGGTNRSASEVHVEYDTVETGADRLERISGLFKDDPDFEEIVRLGREFRESDRPKDDVP